MKEPETKEGMLRRTTIEMDALASSSLETGESKGSVKVHLHEPSYDKDIPDSCNDNIPQVIYSRQKYPSDLSDEQFSKYDVNYEQSQVDNASSNNESDLDSDIEEEELMMSYFSHRGAFEDYVASQIEGESTNIGTRSTEVIDIDCLTPENISSEQDNDYYWVG